MRAIDAAWRPHADDGKRCILQPLEHRFCGSDPARSMLPGHQRGQPRLLEGYSVGIDVLDLGIAHIHAYHMVALACDAAGRRCAPAICAGFLSVA